MKVLKRLKKKENVKGSHIRIGSRDLGSRRGETILEMGGREGSGGRGAGERVNRSSRGKEGLAKCLPFFAPRK